MSTRRTLSHFVLALFCGFWHVVAAVAEVPDPTALAAQAAAAKDPRASSRLYLQAANNAPAGVSIDYTLLAAEALLAAGDAGAVEALLSHQPAASLDGYQFQRSGLLRAKAQLLRGDAAAALSLLPVTFDAPLAAQGLQVRAQAQFARGDTLAGIVSRVALDGVLIESDRAANREALWRELGHASLGPEVDHGGDSLVRGWIDLARLARNGSALDAYDSWRVKYPGHPGETMLPGLFMPTSSGTIATTLGGGEFGLLLPLTGTLAAASQAIRSGAEAAQKRAGQGAPRMVVFDTSSGVDGAANGALAKGVGLLIGPLRKEDVAAMASRAPPVPVLALNYLDVGRVAPAGFTAFGLAPEDEARAAAEDAASNNHLRALVLAQEGDWGERIAKAFRAQLEARGGTVVSEARFKAAAVDYSTLLKRLLAVDAAEARSRALGGIGIQVQSEAHPRGDVDLIFIAARAPQARLIWPQLRYFRAGGIATYAPAVAADNGPADLGGLKVCDAPWRLASGGEIAALRGSLAASNPRSADAQRLFALGFDAYELARRMGAGALTPGATIDGLTGTLSAEADGAIHRRLSCSALVAPTGEGVPDSDTP